MCGVSDEKCTGFSVVQRLFGSSMVGLLVVLSVPLFFVVLGDAMPLLLSLCNTTTKSTVQVHACYRRGCVGMARMHGRCMKGRQARSGVRRAVLRGPNQH